MPALSVTIAAVVLAKQVHRETATMETPVPWIVVILQWAVDTSLSLVAPAIEAEIAPLANASREAALQFLM